MIEKVYLGDGVYASFDGYQIWLTTENGIEVTNTIALEPPVLENLNKYNERIIELCNSQRKSPPPSAQT